MARFARGALAVSGRPRPCPSGLEQVPVWPHRALEGPIAAAVEGRHSAEEQRGCPWSCIDLHGRSFTSENVPKEQFAITCELYKCHLDPVCIALWVRSIFFDRYSAQIDDNRSEVIP